MPANNREAISVALFNLLKGANGPGANQFQFNSFFRRGYAPGSITGAMLPAAMLVKIGERVHRYQETGRGLGLVKYFLDYRLLIEDIGTFTFNPDDPAIPETEINQILHAVDFVLTPTPSGETQTLGGLVLDAWMEGEAEISQPILSNRLIIAIPIHILAGRIHVLGTP